MTESRTFVMDLRNERRGDVLENCIAAIRQWASVANLQVRLSDIRRTLDQNAAMWPALTDFANQVEWEIDGVVQKLAPEDWKDLLTAAFFLEIRTAPALHGGGRVMLGHRTSKFGRKEMGEFLEFLHAEGAERGVRWSAPARERFDEFLPRGGDDA